MEMTRIVPSSWTGYAAAGKMASQKSWELSGPMKERIIEYAREDAAQNVYMGDKFLALRKKEAAKVAPERRALIGKINRALSSAGMTEMKKIWEADERLICLLFGEPYEAEFQSKETGGSVHVYDGNGDEILTYTAGTGWHAKESKPETNVHRALKAAYYDAFCSARREMGKAALDDGRGARGSFSKKA